MDKPAIIVTLTALEAKNAICREQEELRARISKMAQSGTANADLGMSNVIKKILALSEASEKISLDKDATYAIIQVTPIGGEDGK